LEEEAACFGAGDFLYNSKIASSAFSPFMMIVGVSAGAIFSSEGGELEEAAILVVSS